VEASEIAVACSTARCFGAPMGFARKNLADLEDDLFTADVFSTTKHHYTRIAVRRQFIGPFNPMLLVDDFIAREEALKGLANIVKQSGAMLVGAGVVIEKVFQDGGKMARQSGLEVHALARIKSLKQNRIRFC
jgi:xanthine phosphoribosyltransferase